MEARTAQGVSGGEGEIAKLVEGSLAVSSVGRLTGGQSQVSDVMQQAKWPRSASALQPT